MNQKTTAAALFCTIFLIVLFASCSSADDPVTMPESDSDQLADVTIMYYAHGGGNLDESIIGNLRQMYQAEPSSYENVKIAIEYKFSAKEAIPDTSVEWRMEELRNELEMFEEDADDELRNVDYILWMAPEGNSTFRFVLDPTKTLKEQAEGHYLEGKNADITNPDSLTNFINWAAKACPAKSYVLVLSDHGGGYLPDDDLDNENVATTRGIIYDPAHDGKHFSVVSLKKAIAAASIRPNVIYFDACLMNNLEYQFELKDLTDYIVASTFSVPDKGGIYNAFVECLSGASADMEYAFEKYIEYALKNWEVPGDTSPNYRDMTVTKTAAINQLGKAIREFTDRLCDTYQNGTAEQKQKIDHVTKNAVKIHKRYPYYDIARYMEGMKKALPEVFDDAFWAELQTAFNSCIVGQYNSKYLLDHDYQVDYSVLLAIKGAYQELEWNFWYKKTIDYLRYYHPDGKFTTYRVENGNLEKDVEPDFTLKTYEEGVWGGTLESVYGALAFDKATGWSRWLLLNEQQPSLWCDKDFHTHLPNPIGE